MHDWTGWIEVFDGALVLFNGAVLLYLRRLDRRGRELRRRLAALEPSRP